MVANLVSKRDPKIARNSRISWENRDFPSPKSDFLHSKFDFLQRLSNIREIRENLLERLSDFFNGFLLSLTHFKFSITAFRFSIFLNGFPIFLNGFPLSEKSGKIYLRRQIYERLLSELCFSHSKLQYSAIKYYSRNCNIPQ